MKRIHWLNALFLTLSPVVAVSGITYLAWQGELHWATWILALIMAGASGIGITAGYHRLCSHKSYEATWPVRCLLLFFGAASFQNSAKKWCSDHRRHHQFVDKDPDPYNIKKGFWHAHIGWILLKEDPKPDYNNIPDLIADPLIRFQDRFYIPIAVLTGFLFPMALASLWGDPWGGFFLAGIGRVVLNHHLTFSINSLCHFIGKQPYSEKNSSRDSWILSFLTYGEGYHNFHHSFPTDYRNGIRVYHWDPGKWLIKTLAYLRLTRSLRKTPDEKILQARLQMDEARLMSKYGTAAFLTNARLKFEEAHAQFRSLKLEYKKLKKEKMEAMTERLEELKAELKKAKQTMREASASWHTLCN